MASFGKLFDNVEPKKSGAHPRRETKWIHYEKLIDNKAQYCNEKDMDEIKALADMIDADQAVLQNLLVRKTDTDEYEIIAGHKRRRACKYLVEKEGKEQYAFLPCMVEHLSDVRAEFQLYSSNSHHVKTDYEKMHELERMKFLLESYPEEFPHLQTGRMVERLANQMGMKRTTVGEYLTIAKNLGDAGMQGFAAGSINKSAALELASCSEEEQEEMIASGITSRQAIKDYKKQREEADRPEPTEKDIAAFYKWIECKTSDKIEAEDLKKRYSHACGGGSGDLKDFKGSPRGVRINNKKELTWVQLAKRLKEYKHEELRREARDISLSLKEAEPDEIPEARTEMPEDPVEPLAAAPREEEEFNSYTVQDVHEMLKSSEKAIKIYQEHQMNGFIKEQQIILDALNALIILMQE